MGSKKENIVKPELEISPKLDSEKYVDFAESVVLYLNGENWSSRFDCCNGVYKLKEKSSISNLQNFELTTTKIRNLLSLLNSIYQMISDEQKESLSDDVKGKIQYFKMRCAYEAGRDDAVLDFVKKSNVMKYIDNIKNSKSEFVLFYHYVEALVAYHRFYGGKNN